MATRLNTSVVFLMVAGLVIAIVAKVVYDLPVLKIVGIVLLSFLAHFANWKIRKWTYH